MSLRTGDNVNILKCKCQDLDEFIVPYKHDNLGQLLNKLDDKKAASFTVQNAFFYLYWDNATEVVPNLPKFQTKPFYDLTGF